MAPPAARCALLCCALLLFAPLAIVAPADGAARRLQDAERIACAVPRGANLTLQCQWIRNENAEGADNGCGTVSLVPYLDIFYCRSAGLRNAVGDGLAVALMLAAGAVWWLFLVRLVAVTAQKFVRTLTTISEGVGMRPRLAGVTLLPIGNGAPDMFTALAAVRNKNVSLAVGASIGSSLFVTTFVVGAVIYGSGGTVDAKGMMVRDVMFLLVGSIFVFGILLDGSVYWAELVMLILIYIVYVVAVAVGHNVPPLVRAERAAWHEARATMGKPRSIRDRARERRAEERRAMKATANLSGGIADDEAQAKVAQAPDEASMRTWQSDALDMNGVRSPRSSDDTKESIADWRRRRTIGTASEVLLGGQAGTGGGGAPAPGPNTSVGPVSDCCHRARATLQWRRLSKPAKVLAMLELPFTVARSLTVPLAMTEEWGTAGFVDPYKTVRPPMLSPAQEQSFGRGPNPSECWKHRA